MHRTEIVDRLRAERAVAVVRLPEGNTVLNTVEALLEGGVNAVEITLTVPGALDQMAEVRDRFGDAVLLGVGSVTSVDQIHAAVQAGAKYIVSPFFRADLVQAAHALNVASCPGAMTPTECMLAHDAGADIIKIFPADVVGMPFFKAVLAPLPFLKLMPTGGVSLSNADAWLRAGAVAVGVGSALVDVKAISAGDFARIRENARLLRDHLARV